MDGAWLLVFPRRGKAVLEINGGRVASNLLVSLLPLFCGVLFVDIAWYAGDSFRLSIGKENEEIAGNPSVEVFLFATRVDRGFLPVNGFNCESCTELELPGEFV